MIVLPYALPPIAALKKKGLRKLLLLLTAVSLVGKLAYSYDLNAWTLLEGVTPPRAHPNQFFWNVTRFHPFYAVLEVLTGAAAARLVMTDGLDPDGGAAAPKAGSALLPAAALVAVTWARAAGWLPLNDPLTRVLLFVPLFTALVMSIHRNTLGGAKGLVEFLGQPLVTYLGTISFPIFILHGPLGQVFYKKVIATKLFGAVMGPQFFPVYCGIVLLSAALVQKLFLENKKVQEISGNVTKAISDAL
ncbi:hypothetical protein MNEG_9324 [Monoraphidium neglectum]|uniref:Acyltransferase 3 domain-containing protein n=1 Tax=Monoraphidium neglectum TaxID=145388 RepID=A0A0D2MWL7_9CHLO|nr:hypothetical protein MNEG_9324 [Monoraphidium neglectum]KIY98635.1 hypothetical protein MNEG_9324 [Monoraphidium neglectum]|eukprot:XP_013897655.1 hypothetical protein MNEG_9324 [Monoraphidium neglectum]